jgi:hypothetical protein
MSSYIFKLAYDDDINMLDEISFSFGFITADIVRLSIAFVNFRLGTVTKESEKIGDSKKMHMKKLNR